MIKSRAPLAPAGIPAQVNVVYARVVRVNRHAAGKVFQNPIGAIVVTARDVYRLALAMQSPCVAGTMRGDDLEAGTFRADAFKPSDQFTRRCIGRHDQRQQKYNHPHVLGIGGSRHRVRYCGPINHCPVASG